MLLSLADPGDRPDVPEWLPGRLPRGRGLLPRPHRPRQAHPRGQPALRPRRPRPQRRQVCRVRHGETRGQCAKVVRFPYPGFVFACASSCNLVLAKRSRTLCDIMLTCAFLLPLALHTYIYLYLHENRCVARIAGKFSRKRINSSSRKACLLKHFTSFQCIRFRLG